MSNGSKITTIERREEVATVNLSRRELEDMMTSALVRAFRDIGLDARDPKSVFRLRKNLEFLNDWRETCDLIKRKGVLAGIGTIVAALLFVMAIGVKTWLGQ